MKVIELIAKDYTLQLVSLGSMLLGIISGVLGSFAVIKKQSLLGDAVSHAALPGICLAFIIIGTKKTEVLLLGALISGLLATFIITSIVKYSKIKFDSALALVLSVFFGGGLVLMTYIQKLPNANQAGLDKFIYGQASTLLERDVRIMFILGVVLIPVVILFWKEFKIATFDEAFAESVGFSTGRINMLILFMIVIAIIIGLQTVGVILMSAMLIAPAVAARQWTDRLSIMVLLSALFGAISGVTGTIVSSLVSNLPTGPTIVLIISGIVLLSLIFAPNRGLFRRILKNSKGYRLIYEDIVLVNIYDLHFKRGEDSKNIDFENIKASLNMKEKSNRKLEKLLASLNYRGLVNKEYNMWSINDKGISYIKNNIKGGGE